jgi:hypothetical protein
MLQTSGLPDKDVPVKPQSCLDDKTLKEMLLMKGREIEVFKIEKEFDVQIFKNKLEVRNISVCKLFFTQNLWKFLYTIIIIIIIIMNP